jgi:hypothetical protein
MITWDQIYDYLGIRDFIYTASSTSLQDDLFGVKLIFIFFTIFFLSAVVYFYLNSSYLQYHFLQDTAEFLSSQSYGLREINKRWKKIIKRTEFGTEHEYKLAIIEADDFLYQTMDNRGFEGETFEEMVDKVAKKSTQYVNDILFAHSIRNLIVYDPDYKLESSTAKKILSDYERAIKEIALA